MALEECAVGKGLGPFPHGLRKRKAGLPGRGVLLQETAGAEEPRQVWVNREWRSEAATRYSIGFGTGGSIPMVRDGESPAPSAVFAVEGYAAACRNSTEYGRHWPGRHPHVVNGDWRSAVPLALRGVSEMVKATQLRPGMVIQFEGDLYTVFTVDHRTPGNKRGAMATRLRNLKSGAIMDYRFRAEEFVERAILDEIEYEFLYADGDGWHFMNVENFEQIHLGREVLGDAVDYLLPGVHLKLEFYEGKPLGAILPDTVDLTVTDTEPTVQKATASAVMKPAKLETGLVINVPPFINNGDRVRVDTSEARYVQRAQ
ncbi:MAG TPA: elongation factor P [Candidatus Acidoferrales bacterium]|nr:elongation factor P [Candidatus Acidoferrales bacterium]